MSQQPARLASIGVTVPSVFGPPPAPDAIKTVEAQRVPAGKRSGFWIVADGIHVGTVREPEALAVASILERRDDAASQTALLVIARSLVAELRAQAGAAS